SRAGGEGAADGLVAEGTLDDHVDAWSTAGTCLASREVRGADDCGDDRTAGPDGVVLVVEHGKRGRGGTKWGRTRRVAERSGLGHRSPGTRRDRKDRQEESPGIEDSARHPGI